MGDRQTQTLTMEALSSINRRLFETALDLMLVTNRRGRLIQVSPSSLSLLGRRRAPT